MTTNSSLDPQRTVLELQELRALTGDANGAQRVAWSDTWLAARDWYRSKLAELPVEVHQDEAGNIWATLPGESDRALLIGGHLDSVPNGGWLDGCLNVLAGLEVLRRLAGEGTPPLTVRLVDWADEEGARFGRSLLGSSACAGALQPDVERNRTDKAGIRLEDALRRCGVEIDQMGASRKELVNAAAYLELHIEQGPVLESMGLPLGVVVGTCGVERHAITFTGQAAHAGSTPMHLRRDAFGAAAKLGLEIREIAKRHNGVCTVGRCITQPGIVTAVVGECEITLDQRHIDADALAAMLREAKEAGDRIAAEENVDVTWSRIWQIEPIPFHPQLIDLCDQATRSVAGATQRMASGPLHDAAEVARAGVPTVMMFVQSLRGLSHTVLEDTKLEHVEMSVVALDRLASQAMGWIGAQSGAVGQ
jgi:hydantoinase/carbamoylase family amidase